jgi:hypothetical protein
MEQEYVKKTRQLERGARIRKEDHAIGAWNRNKQKTTPLEHGTRISKEDHAFGACNRNKQSRPRHWSIEQEYAK